MSLRAFGVPASIDALKEEEKKKKRTKSKKGVAVKLGNELDPDYDAEDAEEEEEEDDEERVSVEPRGPLPPWGSMPAPALSLPAFKKAVDATVREFLREADIEACLRCVPAVSRAALCPALLWCYASHGCRCHLCVRLLLLRCCAAPTAAAPARADAAAIAAAPCTTCTARPSPTSS